MAQLSFFAISIKISKQMISMETFKFQESNSILLKETIKFISLVKYSSYKIQLPKYISATAIQTIYDINVTNSSVIVSAILSHTGKNIMVHLHSNKKKQ